MEKKCNQMSTIKKFLIKIYETKCVDIKTRVESLERHCVQCKLNVRKSIVHQKYQNDMPQMYYLLKKVYLGHNVYS